MENVSTTSGATDLSPERNERYKEDIEQPRYSRRETILTMIGVLLVMLLASLDQTIVATALPRIIADLQGFDRYTWVSTAYLLTSTVMVPIYGKLSDIFGRKPLFLFGIVIFLAGLQDVPRQLYEAADIDGARRWHRVRYITIPMVTPVILFNLIIGLINAFQYFTQAYVMTNGGPINATLFYALLLYRNAFQYIKMGYASAMAWILFAVVLVCTLAVLWSSRRWVYYSGAR